MREALAQSVSLIPDYPGVLGSTLSCQLPTEGSQSPSGILSSSLGHTSAIPLGHAEWMPTGRLFPGLMSKASIDQVWQFDRDLYRRIQAGQQGGGGTGGVCALDA
jgi:hypothetical protein